MRRLRNILLTATALMPLPALAGPQGGVVVNGRAQINNPGTATVTITQKIAITKPITGKPATAANGGTIGFAMKSAEQAKAWHDAGVKNGGTTCEDPPGVREGGMYLAYLRDPDGNKLCALLRQG